MNIYTIGHSVRDQNEFLRLLHVFGIQVLVDVRSFPGSRHVPWFNKESISVWLPENDIHYLHMPELGGRRKGTAEDDALVAGWTHPSFRSYASYTFSEEYERGIERLMEMARTERVAFFCSECVPWRCHRSIISNTLVAKGMLVYHVLSDTQVDQHRLGKYGASPVLDGERLIYPSHA